MTTTRTRTGKTADLLPIRPPKYPRKEKISPIRYAFRKRTVPKICASTTGYLVFLRRSADCFTDKKRKPEKPGTPTCMCCMCRTPRPVDAGQKDPPVPNPKFGTYISRGIPATRLLGRTPKAPPATASTASFHRRAVSGPDFSAESFSLHFAQTAAKEETHQGGGDAREGGGGGADAHGCC